MRASRAPQLLSGPRRGMLLRLVGIGVAQAAMTLASAWLVHAFFDHAVQGQNVASAVSWLIVALIFAGGALELGQLQRKGEDPQLTLRRVATHRSPIDGELQLVFLWPEARTPRAHIRTATNAQLLQELRLVLAAARSKPPPQN